jgi:hypothetical protein
MLCGGIVAIARLAGQGGSVQRLPPQLHEFVMIALDFANSLHVGQEKRYA